MAKRQGGETAVPDQLSSEDKKKLWAWVRREYPTLDRSTLTAWWGECHDYHEAHGKMMKSWPATFRNWIRKNATGRYTRSERPSQPMGESESEALEMAREKVIQMDFWRKRA